MTVIHDSSEVDLCVIQGTGSILSHVSYTLGKNGEIIWK